jgi:4'-phosphopantetheinyl transferase
MLADLHSRAAPLPPDWAQPPERPRLTGEEVHVWLADIRQPAARVESLSRLLSPDESRRAGSFHFERHREAFAVARGTLRTILASYTGAHPRDLEFAYSPYGKPYLSGAHGGRDLRFNLSHSHGFALYAVAHGREVGVDIEYCRPRVAFAKIAERFFSPLEVENCRRLPERLRREAFFNCWTRKEAFIKAVGEGLSFPLDAFDVSMIPGESAALLGVRVNGLEATRWTLRELQPGSGYVGAVAAEGRDWRPKCWLAHP